MRKESRVLEKGYYENADALRGIAIILVVLAHAIILYPINLHEIAWCNYLFAWVTPVHLPLFFMISGFCYVHKQNYGKYLLNKCRRILIPFVAVSAADMVLRFCFQSMVNRPRSISESLTFILLYGGDYWFLYTMFLIFLIFPPLYKFVIEKEKIGIYGGHALWFLLAAAAVFIDLPTLFTIDKIVYYMLFFMTGVLLRRRIEMGKQKPFSELKTGKRLACFFPCLVLWSVLVYIRIAIVDFIGCEVLIAFVGAVTLYFFVLLLNRKKHLVYIGKYTLQIFMMSGFVLVLSRKLIVDIVHVKNAAVIIGFNLIFDLYIPLVITVFVIKRSKILCFLAGIRYGQERKKKLQ